MSDFEMLSNIRSNPGTTEVPKVPIRPSCRRMDAKTSSPACPVVASSNRVARRWARDAWEAISLGFLRMPRVNGKASTVWFQGGKIRKDFISLYARRFREGTAIPWLKFHTSYLFACTWDQAEFPKAPDGKTVPSAAEKEIRRRLGNVVELDREEDGCFCSNGSLTYLCKFIMHRRTSRLREVAYDILMSKVGCPCAPRSFVEQSYRTHQEALTKQAQVEDHRKLKILTKVENKISQICSRVFRGVRFHHTDAIPSMRACYENGIADGGAAGYLISQWSETESAKRLLSYSYSSELVGMYEESPGRVTELRLPDRSMLVENFQQWVDDQWSNRLDQPLHASPVPILEPLKVRMITKGQAAEYYRAIELQKLMHGALRRHKPFEYIGHPIDDESWSWTFMSQDELPPGYFYVSGDYKAATDNLNPSLSEFAWKSICSHVRTSSGELLVFTPYYKLGLKCLTGHCLHYPAVDGLQPEVAQSWGQLMGSPMSFPILCLINLAATLVALDLDYSEDVYIRINGDDIGFIANDAEYARWKEVTADCGLEFSCGKNYTSRHFLLMDSELRLAPAHAELVWEERDCSFLHEDGQGNWVRGTEWVRRIKPWKLVGYLNQSILLGRFRKGMEAGQPKTVSWTSLGSLSRDLVRGIPSRYHEKILKMFFKTYSESLKRAPVNMQLRFPAPLGVGLYDPRKIEEVVDAERLEQQRKIAAFIDCNPKIRLQLPRSVRLAASGPWADCLKDGISFVDQQTAPVLREKPFHRESRPQVGGQDLLGFLLLGNSIAKTQEGTCFAAGEDDSTSQHIIAADWDATRKWCRLTRQGKYCSLTAMNTSNCQSYSEHLVQRSRIELVWRHPTNRQLYE